MKGKRHTAVVIDIVLPSVAAGVRRIQPTSRRTIDDGVVVDEKVRASLRRVNAGNESVIMTASTATAAPDHVVVNVVVAMGSGHWVHEDQVSVGDRVSKHVVGDV